MENEKPESKKLGSEQAFPTERIKKVYKDGTIETYNIESKPGMSKRFYVASLAMQGILSIKSEYMLGNCDIPVPSEVAKYAYECADELLKQENE